MSVVRGRPPGLAGGMSGSIKRYWSSLRAWPDPKSPTQVRSAGVHIVASRQGRFRGYPHHGSHRPSNQPAYPFKTGSKARATVRLPKTKGCTVSVAATFEGGGKSDAETFDVCKEKSIRFTD